MQVLAPVSWVLAPFLLTGLLAAQQGTQGGEDAAPVVKTQFARVLQEGTQIRCFAGPRSPVYQDKFSPGDVIKVAPPTGEFCQVELPMGVIGYVHSKFCSEPKDGTVSISRPKVSFRYRPQSSKTPEAPVELLAQGTSLHVLSKEGDWWKVRWTSKSAYVPVGDVQIMATSNPTLEKAYASLQKRQQLQWKEAKAVMAKDLAAAKAMSDQVAELAAIRKDFTSELAKDAAQQKLDPLLGRLGQLNSGLAKDAEMRLDTVMLEKRLRDQKVLVDATLLLREASPTELKDVKPLPTQPGDGLDRFDDTGWLVFEADAETSGRFRLEKGNKVITYLSCNSGRYPLELFAGVEVGVSGSRSNKGKHGAPLIDVHKVEVLSIARPR